MTADTNNAGHIKPIDRSTQARVGVVLAMTIMGAWLALHIAAVFFYEWGTHSIVTAPLMVALICWLYVGIFIVAHDCMHGSLIPFRPGTNRLFGWICVTAYAGFNYDLLNRKHHLHHRHSGTEGDPDFDARPPHGFWRWYLNFMFEYFTWREALFFTTVAMTYHFALGADVANLVVFWSVPAILSSLQLFYFGTYLPHVPEEAAFEDRHRARSNEYGWWLSLLTCFHFGYHHEHHLHPDVPWWRLPAVRIGRAD